MKTLLISVLLLCQFWFSSYAQMVGGLQIQTKDDWNLAAQNTNWSRSDVFMTYGTWLIRRDSVNSNITATLPFSGEAGTYRVFAKAFTRNFANATNHGTMEFRLGTNAWERLGFGQVDLTHKLICGTNYTAATAFTNADVRFTWIATGNVQDFYFEAFAISTNLNVAAPGTLDPEPAASDAYIDAWYDYTVPPVESDSWPGNMLRNASFELGFQPGWMYARNSQTTSNDYKATFLKDAIGWTNTARTGNAVGFISNGKARFELYNNPIRLRPGTRQYTLSWYVRGNFSYAVSFKSLAFTNQFVAATPTNAGYTWNLSVNSTNWVRVSTNFWACDKPTPEWRLTLASQVLTSLHFDDILLEEGNTLSTWSPKHGVEFVLNAERNGRMFFDTEPIELDLVTYNYGGSSSNFSWSYVAYGQTNHQFGIPMFSGEFNGSVAPGISTNKITVPPWIPYGHYRIVSRSHSHPEQDETQFSKVWAYDAGTNAVIWIHSQLSQAACLTNKEFGFPVTRTLSPGGYARWQGIEPTNNVFNWDSMDFRVSAHSPQRIWLSTWLNSEIPAWAITSGTMVDTNHLWDYINTMARRYTNKIAFWESRNEPSGIGTNNLRDITITEENAIHSAVPDALYIACGGMADTNIAHNFLVQLSSNTLAGIFGISCHLYPAGGNVVMDMLPDDTDRGRYQQWQALGKLYGKPVFNSESGVYGNGPLRTYNLGVQTGADWTYECLRHEPLERGTYQSAMRAIAILARSLGHGFAGVCYYDARYSTYDRGHYINTNPTVWDFNDEGKPELAAILQFKRLIDPPTFAASVTNIAKTDCYVFGKSNVTVAILWTQDKTNRTVTLSSTNFGQHDVFGNLLVTNVAAIPIGRVAKYLVSRTISTNDMFAMLTNAVVASRSDTNPPVITMDSYPFSAVNGNGTTDTYIKWTALDDTVMNTPLYRSNVLSRYRLGPSASWGNWSESTLAKLTNLVDGMYRLDVQAKDKYNNTSTLSGITFAVTNSVVVPTPAHINNATVSTITLSQ